MGDSWDDFYNNLATDIAPIIALFGEQPTKQFLSESTSSWDAVTLSIMPIGILTIVVSAIRVSDIGILKSFIGRAQEPDGAAEVELCSSTSDSVCELWGGRGVTRIFGRPKILEFVCQERKHEGDKNDAIPTFDIFPTQEFLERQCEKGLWSEENLTWFGAARKVERSRMPMRFAPKPNLTLNIGIRDKSPLWSAIVGMVSILLGTSWLGFCAWLILVAQLKTDSSIISQQTVLFTFLIFSSLWSWLGLGICSHVINRITKERRFTKLKPKKETTDDYAFWLQPGSQAVGDQVFNIFAYSAVLQVYTSSFKHDKTPSKVLLWMGVVSAILGWALQFFCLRSLHPFVSLYLLCATLILAISRAALRARRLDPHKNELRNRDEAKAVEGHELDWQALRIEKLGMKLCPTWPWLEVTTKGTRKASRFSICDEYHKHGPLCHSERSEIIRQSLVYSSTSSQGHHLTTVRESEDFEVADLINMAIGEAQEGTARAAARVFSYRSRLADLAARSPFESERWDTPARRAAQPLKHAIELTANFILSGQLDILASDTSPWLTADTLVWTLGTRYVTHSSELRDEHSESIYVPLQKEHDRWRVDINDLESILGLWTWSSRVIENDIWAMNQDRLVFSVATTSAATELIDLLSLWLPPTMKPEVKYCGTEGDISQGQWTYSSGYKWLVDHREYTHLFSSGDDHLAQNKITIAFVTDNKFQQRAQLLYTAFLRQMCGILQPLQSAEMIKQPNTGSIPLFGYTHTPPFRLANKDLDSLVAIFVESGLGGQKDAFSSIIPAFLACQKVPTLEQLDDQFISRAIELEHDATSNDEMAHIKRNEAADLLRLWSVQLRFGSREKPRHARLTRAWVGIWRRMFNNSVLRGQTDGKALAHVESAVKTWSTNDYMAAVDVCEGNYAQMAADVAWYDGDESMMAELGDDMETMMATVFGEKDLNKDHGVWMLSILARAGQKRLPFSRKSIMNGVERKGDGDSLDFTKVLQALVEWACKNDCPEIFEDNIYQSLYATEWETNALQLSGVRATNAMRLAIESDALECVEVLLQLHGDLTPDPSRGRTVTHRHMEWLVLAVELQKTRVVELLLRSEALRRDLARLLPRYILIPMADRTSSELDIPEDFCRSLLNIQLEVTRNGNNPDAVDESTSVSVTESMMSIPLSVDGSTPVSVDESAPVSPPDLFDVNKQSTVIFTCLPDPISYFLNYAIKERSYDLLQYLLARGNINPNHSRIEKHMIFWPLKIIHQEWYEGLEMILKVVDTEGSLMAQDGSTKEITIMAAITERNWTDGLKLLLASNTGLRAKTQIFARDMDSKKESVLAIAVQNMWTEGLEILLEDPALDVGADAYLDGVDPMSTGTALAVASRNHWLEGMRLLLDHESRPDVNAFIISKRVKGTGDRENITILGDVILQKWEEGLKFVLKEPGIDVGAYVRVVKTGLFEYVPAKETALEIAERLDWAEGMALIEAALASNESG